LWEDSIQVARIGDSINMSLLYVYNLSIIISN
jgi:hypothetical protein